MFRSDRVVVADLDNTLCETRHREHLVAREPRDWLAYSMACSDDEPIEFVADIVRHLGMRQRVFMLSGRNNEALHLTTDWLNRHEIPWDVCCLRMPGDVRHNLAYKAACITRWRSEGIGIELVIDDHPGVIQWASSVGIPGLWVSRPENPHFPTMTDANGDLHMVEPVYHEASA